MKPLNKKGALYHWILIALIPAIAIFIYLSVDLPTYGAKGTWAISVERASILAQTDTLSIENQARQVLKTVSLDIEEQALLQDYGCGTYRGRSVLNNQQGPCQITPKLQTDFQEKANREVTRVVDIPFNIIFSNGKIIGTATQPKTIGSFDAIPMRESDASNELVYSIRPFKLEYNYLPSFEITTPLFEKINKYRQDAPKIVQTCQNQESVLTCELDTYTICNVEIKNNKRLALICEKGTQDGIFALDLTPTAPIPISEYTVEESDSTFTFKIPTDTLVDGYNLYLTNADRIALEFNQPKDPTEIFSTISENFNEFYIKIPLTLEQANLCPQNKENNKPYLCANELYYIINNEKIIPGETYYIGITSTKNQKESTLDFVKPIQLQTHSPIQVPS